MKSAKELRTINEQYKKIQRERVEAEAVKFVEENDIKLEDAAKRGLTNLRLEFEQQSMASKKIIRNLYTSNGFSVNLYDDHIIVDWRK